MTATTSIPLNLPAEAAIFIAGEWQRGRGTPLVVTNPSTGRTLTHVPGASLDQVATAIGAAQAARRDFARWTATERAALVRQIGSILRANADRLAPIIAAEVGKPLREARLEVASAASYADYMAGWALRIEGEIPPADARDEMLLLQREPLGIVAAITAWNYPLDLLLRKLAPALVMGNCVIAKPTEVTPLSAIAAMQAITEGLPELPRGVLSLVPGGRDVGHALVSDPGVNMVTMTGHRNSGKAIMAAAAANLTRVALELGGHAPALVFADADLDRAVEALVEARFANAGQVCTSADRILVARSIHDAFLDRFVDQASNITVGSPEEDPRMGPLVSAGQLSKVRQALEMAEAEGAQTVLKRGDERGDGGFWFGPTILTGLRPDMSIMREETFGPVASVMAFDDVDEAMQIANDTPYGLSAFVFTNDYRIAHRAARELEFGEIYVNRTMGEALQGFHSGYKQSGLGGEDGKHGVLKFTQLKSVYHHFG